MSITIYSLLHLLIQILSLLLMLKVGNELLDGFYHLSLGEVLFLEDAFQLIEEPIHLSHFMASAARRLFIPRSASMLALRLSS